MAVKSDGPVCRMALRCVFLTLFWMWTAAAGPAASQVLPTLSSDAHASVLTVLPGKPLYSAFGHTAIRIRDDSLGIDAVYNFGTFDFDTDWFYLKFARGLLDYRLARNRFEDVMTAYTEEERPIIEQRIDLDQTELRGLILRLEHNYLPENRYYRYDFFFDNCSTRPRDVIETTAGGQIADPERPDGRSFRHLIHPYLRYREWTLFGIDILLGATSDRMASEWETLFLPDELMESLETAAPRGEELVSRTDTLFWPRDYERSRTSPMPGPLFFSIALLLIGVVGLLSPWRAQAGFRYFDAAVFGFAGFAGVMMLLLWFATQHTVTGDNWNVLWALPTNLVVAVGLLLRKKGRLMLALLAMAALSVAVFLAGRPVIDQHFHIAVTPLALLLLVRGAYRIRVSSMLLALLVLLSIPESSTAQTERRPIRDFGFFPGVLPTGPHNAITDIDGVLVGHFTLDEGDSVRTGATAILPHDGNLFRNKVPAAIVVGNGFGKLAGSTQVVELGEIETPIILTNTLSVSRAVDAVIGYTLDLPGNEDVRSVNAVVGETNDGFLNDIRARALQTEHVLEAIAGAATGPVEQGSVGAGRGTIAFGWKGGIGTSSRVLPEPLGGYAVGVLVQTNYGGILQILGADVGRELGRYYLKDVVEATDKNENGGSDGPDGSIMIVVATDAPLSDRNLRRLASRALAGLARTGSSMTNGSGDYVIAFSTARGDLPNERLSPLLQAVIEATEEAIYNSLFTATTVSGDRGTIEALPIEPVLELLRRGQ